MSPDGTQAGRRGATAWDASQAAAFAGGAGSAAAAVHFAGALKSLPGVAALPVDLTVAAAAAMLPLLLLTAADRRWHLDRALAAPLAGCVLLPMWLAVAGSWSASAVVLAEKLPQAALLGPAMLVAGALVGADAAARRGFCSTTLGIGLLVGGAVAWGVATDAVVLGRSARRRPGAGARAVPDRRPLHRLRRGPRGAAAGRGAQCGGAARLEHRGAVVGDGSARAGWTRGAARTRARRRGGAGAAPVARGPARGVPPVVRGGGGGRARRSRRSSRRARRGCRTNCARWSGSSARRRARPRRGR